MGRLSGQRRTVGCPTIICPPREMIPPSPSWRGPDTSSRSRRVFRARFGRLVPPSSSEGAGNAGRPMRPIAACAMLWVERTRVSQVIPESPGIPRAMVLRLTSCSSRRSAFLPPSSLRSLLLTNLTPASRRQNHTTSPSASSALVFSTVGVHRIPPRVRDDREPPLVWDGTAADIKVICGWGQEKFLEFRKTILWPARTMFSTSFRGACKAREPGIRRLRREIPGSRWRAPRNDEELTPRGYSP